MKLSFNRTFAHWGTNLSKRPILAGTVAILWLLLLGWLAFFWNLGNTGLIDETEPLFAEAARQMTLTGDWITPFFNGETRFDKPPLVYWLMAIAYSTIGVNEWAVRLPSAFSAFGLMCLGFYTLWWFGKTAAQSEAKIGLTAGLGAALIALNPETIAWARIGVSDMLLTGCMGGALLSFFLGYAQPAKPPVQARWYLAFYLLIALAILAKGPVGIVLPGLIIGSFLLYIGNLLPVLREMRCLRGLLLIAAIALPWYVLVTIRNGDAYLNSFFGYHNIERFTSVVNHHSAPWYFYFIVVLLGFAPWSVYLPAAIALTRFWQRRRWRVAPRSSQLSLFALFWFGGIFGFFTVAITKLPSYVLPLMPAAAILVALLWGDQLTQSQIKRRHNVSSIFYWSSWLNILFLAIIALALIQLPNLIGTDPAIPNLRQLIQQSGLTSLGGLIWAVSAIAGVIVICRRQWRWLLSINLLGFVAFFIFVLTPTYFLIDQTRQLPLRELAAIADVTQKPQEELIMVGFKKPSVVFYAQQPVTYLRGTDDATAYIEQKFSALKAPPLSVLVLGYPNKLKQLELESSPQQNLGTAGAYQLIRVFSE